MPSNSVFILLAFVGGFSLSGLLNTTLRDRERVSLRTEIAEVTRLHKQAETDLNELRASLAAGLTSASLMPADTNTTTN